MARDDAPYPYDWSVADAAYLYPPQRVMQVLDAAAYTRDSLPWFPPRQQGEAISESLFPPRAETSATVADRSHGFGWSDTPHPIGGDDHPEGLNVYAYTDAVDAGTNGDGQGVDCSTEGIAHLGPKHNTVALTGADGIPSGAFKLSVGGTTYQYVVAGTKLYRSSNGTTFAAVQADGADLPAALTGRPVVFTGSQSGPLVYFPMGAAQTFRVWDGDTANALGSPTSTDNNEVIDFLVAHDRVYGLWHDTATNRYRVSSFQDGIAGGSSGTSPTWAPSISVSDESDPAVSLMFADGKLWIGCQGSLHTLDAEDETFEKEAWRPPTSSSTNFNPKGWTQHNAELWFTASQNEYRVGGGKILQVGPETLPNNRTPVRGVVRAKASDGYCVYQFLRTEAGVTYLLKWREYDQGRRSAHHVISRVGTYNVDFAFVGNVHATNPILYYGAASGDLRYLILPRNGLYPPSDSVCEFAPAGYLYDTRQHGGMYFVTKALLAFTGRVDAATSTETVTSYFRTGSADTFTQFGTTSITAEPGSRFALAEPEICAWWEGRLRLLRGGTANLTPKVLASTYAFALRPVAKGQFTVFALIEDHARARNGAEDPRSAYDIEDTLVGLDSGATPVTLVTKFGKSYSVFVDEVRIIHFDCEADEPPRAVARVTMTEFASRISGSWGIVGGYTWSAIGSYTWAGIQQLTG